MKLCWDKIEGLRYNKKTDKWYSKSQMFEYKEHCDNCGEPFLSNRGKTIFCCVSCGTASGKNSVHYGKKRSKEVIKRIVETKCGKDCSGYRSKNIPIYNTYASQLEWCEEVRRSPNDKNVLEVKCFKCNKWYVPDLTNVHNRVKSINGKRGGDRFYCSDECKHSCSVYRKRPNTLMKEDAVRAGRLKWISLDREMQPELRSIVLERDEYQCVKCGSEEGLQCHHIYPVNIEPLLSADIDNCITLCYDCHKKVHQKDGCRYPQLEIEEC